MKTAFRMLALVLILASSLAGVPLTARAAPTLGALIKRGDHAAVYYYGADGKRYVFPNERTFKTWYADFSGVQIVTAAEMAAIAIGGNVTYRPGAKMIKIDTDPKVYAISKGGVLRPLASETVARALYGNAWAKQVHDIPDAFFTNYTMGSAVASTADYDKDAELASAPTINADKGLVGAPPPAPEPEPEPEPAPEPTPVPSPGQLPSVPAEHELVDLIVDNGFETSLGGFAPNGTADGTVAHETANPIAGGKSLRVNVERWGRIIHYTDYAWENGPYADSLTAKAKIRVETGSTTSKKLQVCAIAYLQGDANPRSQCGEYPIAASTVLDVYHSLPVSGAQLDRVMFQFKLNDDGTISAVADEAHLYVVQKVGAPAPTPEPSPEPTPDPDPGPAPTPSPSTDLEVSGFNPRPTNWRSMTAEMDLRDDVSSSGAAANAAPKDVRVTLHPAADAVGGTRRVSFGFPLPPGVLVNAANVKVTDAAGQEIPAFVRSLGAWERMPDARLLCDGLTAVGNPGLRSVLIQFDRNITSTAPFDVIVGVNRARTQSLAAEVPVRDTYRVVNDGTYAPSVNTSGLTIREPSVLAAIDHAYLGCAALVPMPNQADSRGYMAASDQATEDFFYSVINRHDLKQDWPVTSSEDMVNFYTDPEPWLYQRAQSFYNGYVRTGNVDMLREAHRAADHYQLNIYGPEHCATTYYPSCVGSFRLKNPDPTSSWHDLKYSYSEDLMTDYLLTGDTTVLKKIGYISWGFEFHIDMDSAIETERHLGYTLLAHAVDADLTGSAHQKAVVDAGIQAMRTRQTSTLDGNSPNGCFNYSPEGDPNSFSPWMSSLLAYGFLRGYQATGNASVAPALTDLARCEMERGMTTLKAGEDGPMSVGRMYPFYIAASYGTPTDLDGHNPWNGFEHAIDVAVPMALGAVFTADPAQKALFSGVAKELLLTHDESIAYWTRDSVGRAKYRMTPPRKYGWQYKNAQVIGWMDGKGTY